VLARTGWTSSKC